MARGSGLNVPLFLSAERAARQLIGLRHFLVLRRGVGLVGRKVSAPWILGEDVVAARDAPVADAAGRAHNELSHLIRTR